MAGKNKGKGSIKKIPGGGVILRTSKNKGVALIPVQKPGEHKHGRSKKKK